VRLARASAFAAIAFLSAVRVASTYRVFSQTVDEPIHIAAGLQWLTNGGLDLDPEHPPLARIAFAAIPFIEGARVASGPADAKGNEVLLRGSRYRHNLAAARVGNLPFFLLALAVVAIWTWRLFGAAAAFVAMALFASLPPVLAHAGLATTDMAACATVAAALLALTLWLERPTLRSALLLGLALGIGVSSKYSFFVFFPSAAIVFLLVHRKRPAAAQLAIAILVALLVTWGVFRFSVATLNSMRLEIYPAGDPRQVAAKYAQVPGYEWVRSDIIERYRHSRFRGADFVDWAKAAGYPSPLARRHGNTMIGAPPLPAPSLGARIAERFRSAGQWISVRVPLPAPALVEGLFKVARHNETGHPTFLFGHLTRRGWWFYFPVVLFFKTPVAFIVFALAGVGQIVKKMRGEALAVVIAPFAMLLPVMFSQINLGVRHVLPLYPFLSIAGAYAVVELWRRGFRWRVEICALLAWLVIGSAVAHPDYLPYFNEAALGHGERIAIDSNLDWGQDLLRLAAVVRTLRIQHLYVDYFGSADPTRLLPCAVEELPGAAPVRGWVAVSETALVMSNIEWLKSHRPVREVGKSVRLYELH